MFPTTLNHFPKHGGIISPGTHQNFRSQSSRMGKTNNRKLCLEKKLQVMQWKKNYNGRKCREEKNIFSNLLSLKISLNRKNEKRNNFLQKKNIFTCVFINNITFSLIFIGMGVFYSSFVTFGDGMVNAVGEKQLKDHSQKVSRHKWEVCGFQTKWRIFFDSWSANEKLWLKVQTKS